jgi:hypothetical protein
VPVRGGGLELSLTEKTSFRARLQYLDGYIAFIEVKKSRNSKISSSLFTRIPTQVVVVREQKFSA